MMEVINPLVLREQLDLSREKMARIFDVSAKTVERWEKEAELPPRPAVQARASKMRELVDLGLAVYTPEGFAEFMHTPLREFGHLTPLKLLEFGREDDVLAALAADYEGVS